MQSLWKSALISIALLSGAPAAIAQEQVRDFDPYAFPPSFVGDKALVRFSLDERGRLCISPSPSAGGAIERELVVWNYLDRFDPAGVFGRILLLAPGDRDLASAGGSSQFLTRVRSGSEDQILELLDEPLREDAPPGLRQFQLQAIHAAGDQDLTIARERLTRLEESERKRGEHSDPEVLAAIHLALLKLDRKPIPVREHAEIDLFRFLQRAPQSTMAVLRVDNTVLPPHGLGTIAEICRLESLRREIKQAGGALTPPQWAGARLLASIAPILGYETARLFGNARIDQAVAAVGWNAELGGHDAWLIRMTGRFDTKRLPAGLSAIGFTRVQPAEDSPLETWRIDYRGSHIVLRTSADTIDLRIESFPMRSPYRPLAEGKAREWASRFGEEAAVSLRILRGPGHPLDDESLPTDWDLQTDRNNPHFVRLKTKGARLPAAVELERQIRELVETLRRASPDGFDPNAFRFRVDAETDALVFEGDIRRMWSNDLVPIVLTNLGH